MPHCNFTAIVQIMVFVEYSHLEGLLHILFVYEPAKNLHFGLLNYCKGWTEGRTIWFSGCETDYGGLNGQGTLCFKTQGGVAKGGHEEAGKYITTKYPCIDLECTEEIKQNHITLYPS